MQEPYFKSTVYDMSGGLLPAPADDGYNIVMPVYTPTGPIEKTKVYSQKEFIEKYMTATKILPDDNESAQFAYMVLNQNPVYVMRACPTELREGMSCEGIRYLFDSDYNLLSSYKQFKFDITPQPAAESYDFSVTPAGGSAITSTTGQSLSDFICGLSSGHNADGILSSNKELVISTKKLTPSSNIGKWEESIKSGAYQSVTFSTSSLTNYDYVSLNGNSYQYINDLASEPYESLSNPTAFYAKCTNAQYMGLFILGEENCLYSLSGVTLKLSEANNAGYTSQIEACSNVSGLTLNTTSHTVTVTANNTITPGSMGAICDSAIKNETDDITSEEGVAVGDKFWEKSSISGVDYNIYTITDTQNVASSAETNVTEFTYEAVSSQPSGSFPAAPSSNSHFTCDDTKLYIVTKDSNGNVQKYYLGDKDLYGVDGSGSSSVTSIANSAVGNTCFTYTNASSLTTSTKITRSVVTTKAATSEGYGTAEYTLPTSLPYMTIHKTIPSERTVNIIYKFYCSAETLPSTFDDSGIILVNANSSVEFLCKVLAKVVNLDGMLNYYFPSTTLTMTGIVKLYNPSYGSTVVSAADANAIRLDAGSENASYYYYAVDPDNNNALVQYEYIDVTVGTKVYYTGDEAPAASSIVKLKGGKCSASEFMELLQNALGDVSIYRYNDYFISTDTALVTEVSTSSEYTMTLSSSVVNQTPTETFAVVCKFPAETAVNKYSYTYDSDSKIVSMNFNYKDGVFTEDWTFSFVSGVTDSYGVDQWYTRVSSDYFKVVKLKDNGSILSSFTSPKFGNKVSIPEYSASLLSTAISALPEYEDGLHYDIISDAGVSDPSLAQTISSLAQEFFAVYPVSLPPYTKVADYVSYVGAISNIHHYECRMLAASDRLVVSGFSKVFPGSYKLISQMISAFRNPSTEFAPNFDLNHGTVGMSNPVQSFKKKEREALLDIQVESLKGGITTPYYINDNITAQSSKSYMSEDQNVRMTNTAVHIVEDMAKNYIGELNTSNLRAIVQENINSTLNDRLFKGRSFGPAQYLAVCDDSNNTALTIDQNKLIIDLYASFTPSVKYILINHYIVNLSQTQA